jgi:hypothetical protein
MARIWVNHVTNFRNPKLLLYPSKARTPMSHLNHVLTNFISVSIMRKYPTTFMLNTFRRISSSGRRRGIFEILSAGSDFRNSEFHHIEGYFPYLSKFLHNKVLNKKLCTFTTMSRLVPINILKLINNKEYDLINYKVHRCILHASPSWWFSKLNSKFD